VAGDYRNCEILLRRRMMRLTYDPKANLAYARLREKAGDVGND
jgi:hypothetical protein